MPGKDAGQSAATGRDLIQPLMAYFWEPCIGSTPSCSVRSSGSPLSRPGEGEEGLRKSAHEHKSGRGQTRKAPAPRCRQLRGQGRNRTPMNPHGIARGAGAVGSLLASCGSKRGATDQSKRSQLRIEVGHARPFPVIPSPLPPTVSHRRPRAQSLKMSAALATGVTVMLRRGNWVSPPCSTWLR